MDQRSRHPFALLFVFILAGFLFSACTVETAAPQPTTLPTTPILPTPIPPSLTPDILPSMTPTPTLTVTQPLTLTPANTATPQLTRPYLSPTPTVFDPCSNRYECLSSPNRQWAATITVGADGKRILQISTHSGKVVWSFPSQETVGDIPLYYSPLRYDPASRWLYAELRPRFYGDGGFGPVTFGLVMINLQTGEMAPLLAKNYYYGFSFSPDGSQIGYTLEYMAGIINTRTAEQKLYALTYRFPLGVRWSPDGIQFASMPVSNPDKEDFIHDIVLITPGSNQPVTSIKLAKPFNYIEWDSSGNFLYATAPVEGGTAWYKVDPVRPGLIPVPSPTPAR